MTSYVVGYPGGINFNSTYKGMKDYTESILVYYDSILLSYKQTLLKWNNIVDLSGESV